MNTYFVILSDQEGNIDWFHPTEIRATDKNDAKNAIMESTPAEYIQRVFTEKEYAAFMSNRGNKSQLQLEQYNNSKTETTGKEFFANMLSLANDQAEAKNKPQPPPIEEEDPEKLQKPIDISAEKPKKQETKYFTDNGIMFKVENGILYKKCWETVALTETVDEATGNTILPEYRIINTDSQKPIKSDKYSVQHLVWKELNNL